MNCPGLGEDSILREDSSHGTSVGQNQGDRPVVGDHAHGPLARQPYRQVVGRSLDLPGGSGVGHPLVARRESLRIVPTGTDPATGPPPPPRSRALRAGLSHS